MKNQKAEHSFYPYSAFHINYQESELPTHFATGIEFFGCHSTVGGLGRTSGYIGKSRPVVYVVAVFHAFRSKREETELTADFLLDVGNRIDVVGKRRKDTDSSFLVPLREPESDCHHLIGRALVYRFSRIPRLGSKSNKIAGSRHHANF